MTAVNESEAFVHDLCRTSFLYLWSIENPMGPKPNKELCDALIVFGDNVLIISVKDRQITPSGNLDVDANRWYRYAIEGSIKQLRGAHRALDRMTTVRRRDHPDIELALPPGTRRVHFIAVTLGGEIAGPAAATSGRQARVGHVFDRVTFDILLRELDTTPDLLRYLVTKEAFLDGGNVVLEGGECDLLGLCPSRDRSFPPADTLVIGAGLWDQLLANPAYQRKLEADASSRVWDEVIEVVTHYLLRGELVGDSELPQTENELRWMASGRGSRGAYWAAHSSASCERTYAAASFHPHRVWSTCSSPVHAARASPPVRRHSTPTRRFFSRTTPTPPPSSA